jgi:homoserine dehydrogenase
MWADAAAMGRPLRVGILGFGTVGSGAYRMLEDNKDAINRRIGMEVEIARIGIRDLQKPRIAPSHLFTTDLESLVLDPAIDVVLELMGGIEPAGPLIERALQNGKHVVTANKELMAKDGSRLIHIARKQGLDLHFEAAVGGGIPLIQPIKHQLAGNDVLKLMGILNGTTNYILTRMSEEGSSLEEALAEAQAKGYAEADPTSDVEGYDPQYKLAILASIAFHGEVAPDGVYREGIRGISQRDIELAEVLGYRIKLVGIVEPVDDGLLARVHPTMLPKNHPLANVNDVYNAVWLRGDFVGDVMFSGRGAGGDPTASAVVGDLIDVGRNIKSGGTGSAIPLEQKLVTVPISRLRTCYYVRLVVSDRPRVLGQIAAIFGEHEVSLSAMEMRTLDEGFGEIAFLTHACLEQDFCDALVEIEQADIVRSVENWIRVENGSIS